MIIAVDGPAASGKGTLARRLAAHFKIDHLDTGSLYRCVALGVLRAGRDPNNESDAITAAHDVRSLDLSDPDLRDEKVGNAASTVAQFPAVRQILLDYQRQVAAAGAVLDGRDIGTVVCPDADHKFYVTASLEIRAERRIAELLDRGVAVSPDEIREEMAVRDRLDRERATSPLILASDAHLLDTTNLDIDSAFSYALTLIEQN
ncbi:MAG TPA: (d)CMP kinase [Sneathiellales bacterium]|jgi:cytidylate kinase|nr:(d)CMP kinase [Sneathiellales bacterium]